MEQYLNAPRNGKEFLIHFFNNGFTEIKKEGNSFYLYNPQIKAMAETTGKGQAFRDFIHKLYYSSFTIKEILLDLKQMKPTKKEVVTTKKTNTGPTLITPPLKNNINWKLLWDEIELKHRNNITSYFKKGYTQILPLNKAMYNPKTNKQIKIDWSEPVHNFFFGIEVGYADFEEVMNKIIKNKKKSLHAPKSSIIIPMNSEVPKNQLFKIPKATQDFLGKIEIKPKHSVVATLDAPQGAGKTRFFYFLMNELASTNNKCLFISLEEHPLSELAQAKKRQYIKPKNQALIDTLSELPTYKELCKIIEKYDCIFIDSWGKMQSGQKLDFDRDLRKKFNGKLFFVIFQRTVTQTMRGGAAAQFDGDIIMKIHKDKNGDFKQNYVYHDKNRYQSKDLNTLKFNIYKQKLIF